MLPAFLLRDERLRVVIVTYSDCDEAGGMAQMPTSILIAKCHNYGGIGVPSLASSIALFIIIFSLRSG